MSYLLANGCSFTASNYGSNSPSYHTEKEKNELGIPLVDWPMWPEYVSTKLGLSHINLGASGGSNTRMVTSTIEQACREKPNIIMHLWTESNRHSFMGQRINDSVFLNILEMYAKLIA